MPKRKSEAPAIGQARRSTRLRTSTGTTSTNPASAPSSAATISHSTKKTAQAKSKSKPSSAKKPSASGSAKSTTPKSKTSRQDDDATAAVKGDGGGGERQYWLLKAEPETRLENGVDVRFSIDDLAAKTEPEPWDGIRNYAARNNLRAMKQGDLAFFYHSNCKEPGIVGTMEIVQEHTPDLSAHDPKAPYYDASSKQDNPKWSVVHVRFRSKFAAPILLKQLREMGGPGKPLENMQMLKLARMSVSKVSAGEWEHLMSIAEELPA